jgi:uncharacterized membrane protein YqjE
MFANQRAADTQAMDARSNPEPNPQGIPALLVSMARTRLELAAIDVESHLRAAVVALMTAMIAVVLGLIAFAFFGVAVIIFFWETHRIAAAAGVLVAYATLAALVALWARSVWLARPAAFSATLHQLELDAEAFRGRL